ncbi:glycosyltransferase [Algoriphagus marincola]|uniref:glycosyltransferase n=1 Tax=Algoriphagus marincola TaxID=264027 RepID=UPI0004076DD3|nr:glycosyltransferase [Algoriphagus marincola]
MSLKIKRKKALLLAIGTRGDIEPFLAIGEILDFSGFEVIYSFPIQFSKLVPSDAPFYPLSSRVIDLIEGKEGKIVMGKANIFQKIKALIYLYREGKKVNKELVLSQLDVFKLEDPDLVVHHGKCSFPILWHLKNKNESLIISPVPYFIHEVKGSSHLGFKINMGDFLNGLTYKLANYGLAKTVFDAQKHLPQDFNFSLQEIKEAIISNKIGYSFSSALITRPTSWLDGAQVLGFSGHHNSLSGWLPSEDLIDFIENHEKILFLTFGSMVNQFPEEISKFFYKILDELKIPTIVNQASGGLIPIEEYQKNENFIFVDSIPYSWILERIYCIIHHGGSGTTHFGLQYACPTMIIPHIIDQYIWNDLIFEKKLGPKGISVNDLPSKNLKDKIVDLYKNEEFKENAVSYSLDMKLEDFKSNFLSFLRS